MPIEMFASVLAAARKTAWFVGSADSNMWINNLILLAMWILNDVHIGNVFMEVLGAWKIWQRYYAVNFAGFLIWIQTIY